MHENTKLPAVILAGGPADPELAEKYSVRQRAAVPIAGRPMVQYVIDALRNSKQVEKVYLVGDIECEGVTQTIPSAGSMIENLIAGVKASGVSDGFVLIATCDIPMIHPEAIDDLISRCMQTEAEFYYPIISRETNEKRFPGMRRTYVRLAEGTFTGGNMMIMKASFVTENANTIREAFGARKSPLKLAGLIGIGTLIRALIAQRLWPGAINVPTLENTVGRILKTRVKAIQSPHPEIGADVDDAEQIRFAETVLSR